MRWLDEHQSEVWMLLHQPDERIDVDQVAGHWEREGVDTKLPCQPARAEVTAVLGCQLNERLSGFASSHHHGLFASRTAIRTPVRDVSGEQPPHLVQEPLLQSRQHARSGKR